MRCQTCGEELREGARFCPTCGTPTQADAATGTPATVQIRRPMGGASTARPSTPTTAAEGPPSMPPSNLEDDAVSGEAAERNERSTPRLDAIRRPDRDRGRRSGPADAAGTVVPPGGRRPGARAARQRPDAGPSPISSPSSADFNTLIQRLGRLVRLDTSVFAEVYADAGATIPIAVFAAAVLLISGLGGMIFIASGIGFDLYGVAAHSAGEFFLRSVLLGTIFGLVMWAAWSGVTMLLLRQLAGVEVDAYGVARVLGLALAPLVLSVLLFWTEAFFGLSWIALGAVGSLAVIGVLEAVDVRPGHGWLATLAGLAVFVIVLSFLGYGFRDLAPGFFAGT